MSNCTKGLGHPESIMKMVEPEIDFGFAGWTCKLHKVPKTFGRNIERFLLKAMKHKKHLSPSPSKGSLRRVTLF
jgi:hypothetical protein